MSTRRIIIAGDRVYRPAGWWTPTVHALLDYLHDVGFHRVPRPLGVVGGQEILTWLPGEAGATSWAMVATDAGLRAFARLLRDYHAAVRGFIPPDGARWALCGRPLHDNEVICHGDVGPWNVLWADSSPSGLLDFDLAAPGDPMLDVTYALNAVTPFRDDAHALRWQGFDAPPERGRRIAVFADAYGLTSTKGMVDAVIRRQELIASQVHALAARGLEPQRTWVADGYLDHLANLMHWTRDNRAAFD